MGGGGGRGKYSKVCGDMPVAELRGVKTRRYGEDSEYIGKDENAYGKTDKNENKHGKQNKLKIIMEKLKSLKIVMGKTEKVEKNCEQTEKIENRYGMIDKVGHDGRLSIRCSGGGSGKFATIDGDVPACMRQPPNDIDSESTVLARGRAAPISTSKFLVKILAKNVQSIQSAHREFELLETFSTLDCDILMLSETWREDKKEI